VGADYSVLSELEPSCAAMMASATAPALEPYVPAAPADLFAQLGAIWYSRARV
jgi:hypothetical protein